MLSFGLEWGGAGKLPYNCIALSGVGDGVESRTERGGSLYTLELGVSARAASGIFAPRTIGRFLASASGVAVGDGVDMPDREYSEPECSYLRWSVMGRERLGKCHATGLSGHCTTGDEGTGTEYDRAWLTGSGCSEVTVEILTSGMGFKSSTVGSRGFAELTGVPLTSDCEDTVALPGVCGRPFIAELAWVGLKCGGESATISRRGPNSRSLWRATFPEERLPLLSFPVVKDKWTGDTGSLDPSIPWLEGFPGWSVCTCWVRVW